MKEARDRRRVLDALTATPSDDAAILAHAQEDESEAWDPITIEGEAHALLDLCQWGDAFMVGDAVTGPLYRRSDRLLAA
jgi:hypothetical protein